MGSVGNRIGRRSWGPDLRIAGTAVLVLLLAGCGYRLAGGGEAIDPGLRTVFVETFANRTGEAHAEEIFRTAFIDRFVREGRFKLAGNRGEADTLCRGTILSLQTSSLAYKASNLAAEERITATLEIYFEQRESGRVIWSDGAFTETADYPVATVGAREAERKNALVKLAGGTAERAYRLMISGF
ncbi:MAG: hypothetical protein KKC25_07135 [Proteobacteria bacterium]|nr:hypothetical protein [Pseudomonadota bacterium]MBU2262369.1 hypothetical protein [Pseudomonadota bacterium]